jgi:myo-inositol-1(or 4)-monophosphatase
MNANRLSEYLSFITETAYQAGRLTLGYYQTGLQVDYKADDSPVTVADRKAEEYIRSQIEKTYPEHTIIGEEFGLKETEGASHRWFIDPIDGTKSFMRGIPIYAVLIGLEIEGRVEVGAAYYPAMNEMLAAATGLGCWWNGRRAHVSTISAFDRALITTASAKAFQAHGRQDVLGRLVERCYFQTGLSDAYGYLLVATGRAECMLDPIMNVWDNAPFPPIFAEAGGYFGDWKGNPTIYGAEAMATTQTLLPQVLEIMRG